MLQPGTILGNRYEIIQLVGSGGMADVYKAKCHKLNRLVAIKVLKDEFGKDADFVKKFHVEAQAAAGLTHPNIVNIYDVGEEAGFHYIVMELVEGMTLQSYIHKKGRLSPEETVQISVQIAKGLEAAHKNNTVHRDIKPQNIIVTEDGRIKVTDFGIARASNTNTITTATIGSVHYFSPEQARGGYVDARSDIYSLGITMYEMVTGSVPFDGDNAVTVALKHLQDEITPPHEIVPELPAALEKIILKATNKKKEMRYDSITEMIGDLRQVFDQTDGAYIRTDNGLTGKNQSPTVILSREDTDKIKQMTARKDTLVKTRVRKDVKEIEPEKEEIFTDHEEVNPKLEKLIFALTILLGIIVAIVVIALIGKVVRNSIGGGAASTETTKQEITTTAADEDTGTGKTVIMPNVLNEKEKKAVSILEEYHLSVEIEKEISNDVEKGYVIRQSVPYGYDVEEGTVIKLVISAGKEKKSIPDVTGKKESDAKNTLINAGFRVKTTEEYSDTVKEGYVISQSPDEGSKAEPDSTVTLVISKGRESEKVYLESMVGTEHHEAQEILKNQGFRVKITKEYSDRYSEGTVMAQNPGSGMVLEGSTVYLTVSLGSGHSVSYQGRLFIECPFENGETQGEVTLVLKQGGRTKTVYHKRLHEDDFPLSIGIQGYEEGSAIVTLLCDGNKVASYDVMLEKVEN